jgi:hypothetical protein
MVNDDAGTKVVTVTSSTTTTVSPALPLQELLLPLSNLDLLLPRSTSASSSATWTRRPLRPCIMSSGMGFPVGKADFGTGLPAFASYHFPCPGDCGDVMPMPSARGNGDWVVYVHVTPEMVKVIEEEPTVFQALESSYVFG